MNPHYMKLARSLIDFALSRSKAVTDLKHPGLKGRLREIFAKDLLSPFLSPNIDAITGIVVDSQGGSSCQIDIIVYDKTLIPSFMFTGEDGIVPIESVLATVEVKSNLTKGELEKSIRNANSVKYLKPKFAEVMLEVPIKSSPLCCVFSFSSNTKPDKEINRLESTVLKVNNDVKDKVYVPLSAICVADTSFTHCTIEQQEKSRPNFMTETKDPTMRFMVFLIDQISILERQRSKMLVSHYFSEDGAF